MRIGVYGGSFDPPHVGHAMVSSWLIWTGRVDRVWLLPTCHHAFDKRLAPFEERVALCRAMASDVHRLIEVDTVEARLPAPNYTLSTLDCLARDHPEHLFRLVVGADVLAQVECWHRWGEIEERYGPIVVGRAGWPPVAGSPTFPDISSTEVRGLIAAGEPFEHLVTARTAALLRGDAAWKD